MAYTQVADPLLDANKPIRSTDIKQMRDNQDDFNGRINALEDPSVRVFSHFAKRVGYTSATANFDDLIVDGTFVDEAWYDGQNFYITNNGGSNAITNEIGQSTTADEHYLRIEASGQGHVIATIPMLFNRGTSLLPITFKARCRMSDNARSLYVGLYGWTTGATLDDPTVSAVPTEPYIILNENTGTNSWRFSSYDGTTTTHGTDLSGLSGGAKVSNDTWFEVWLEFTDDPSDQVKCYLDGVLEETLSADLPTTQKLYGYVAARNGSGDTFDIDRMEVSAAGTLSDSA